MRTDIKTIAPPPPRHFPWQFNVSPNTVGVIAPCYGSSHVIYGLNTKRYHHRKLATLPLRKLDRAGTYHKFTPFILDATLPLVHTWNAIPRNKRFIISFELELPRYLGTATKSQIEHGLNLLSSDRCKRILALSEFARRFALRRFEEHGYRHLEKKLTVFRGAVNDPYHALASHHEEGQLLKQKPLSAVVVGTHLFHKGAMCAIRAFERLRNLGMNVTLTLIGDFETHSHVFRENMPDANEWRLHAQSHDWIRFCGPMPNASVLKELLAHDICIYTSLDESLGWLPIEAGMLGIPVLGNNLCAFPEFVSHKETGWLIDLPLRSDGRWTGLELERVQAKKALDEANDAIVTGIVNCITYVHEHPEVLLEWGKNGRRMIKAMYDLEQASANLERIYDEALA